MFTMNKTYEVITPESAEHGDADEQGFDYQDKEFDTLAEMADEIINAGAVQPSSSEFYKGIWYSTIDPDRNIQTGAETYYSFHPSDSIDEFNQRLLYKLVMKGK